MEADDPLGVPCGLLALQVEPHHGVVEDWVRRWSGAGDPLLAAWVATKSVDNMNELLRVMVGVERADAIVAEAFAAVPDSTRCPPDPRVLVAVRALAPSPPPFGVLLGGHAQRKNEHLAARAAEGARRDEEARAKALAESARIAAMRTCSFAEAFEKLIGSALPVPIPADAVATSQMTRATERWVSSMETPAARGSSEHAGPHFSHHLDMVSALGAAPPGYFSVGITETRPDGYGIWYCAIAERARVCFTYLFPRFSDWARVRVATDLSRYVAFASAMSRRGARHELSVRGGTGYWTVEAPDGRVLTKRLAEVPWSPEWKDMNHALLMHQEPQQRAFSWAELAAAAGVTLDLEDPAP